jgi:hypothetical protein
MLSISAAAHAFPFLPSWHQPSDSNPRAGAGGIYSNGSSRDWGLTCANCHINNKNQQGSIDASIVPNPAWEMVNGVAAYKPGQVYTITFNLLNEHNLAPMAHPMDNLNGFTLTVEDSGGKTAGVFTSDTNPPVSSAACPAMAPAMLPKTGTTYVYGDCHGILYLPTPNITSWTFTWTAPKAGSGTLTVFYGVVDGDHDGASSLDDDVKVGTLKLTEGN